MAGDLHPVARSSSFGSGPEAPLPPLLALGDAAGSLWGTPGGAPRHRRTRGLGGRLRRAGRVLALRAPTAARAEGLTAAPRPGDYAVRTLWAPGRAGRRGTPGARPRARAARTRRDQGVGTQAPQAARAGAGRSPAYGTPGPVWRGGKATARRTGPAAIRCRRPLPQGLPVCRSVCRSVHRRVLSSATCSMRGCGRRLLRAPRVPAPRCGLGGSRVVRRAADEPQWLSWSGRGLSR